MSHPRTVSSIIAVALGLVITIAGVHGSAATASATPLGADEDVIIELPPTVTVQPAVSAIDATCDAPGGYTLSGEPEVIWFVDGVETSSGTHSVGPRTLSIEAAPFLGAFAPGIRTEWTISVAAAGSCETDAEAVPAEPVQTVRLRLRPRAPLLRRPARPRARPRPSSPRTHRAGPPRRPLPPRPPPLRPLSFRPPLRPRRPPAHPGRSPRAPWRSTRRSTSTCRRSRSRARRATRPVRRPSPPSDSSSSADSPCCSPRRRRGAPPDAEPRRRPPPDPTGAARLGLTPWPT